MRENQPTAGKDERKHAKNYFCVSRTEAGGRVRNHVAIAPKIG